MTVGMRKLLRRTGLARTLHFSLINFAWGFAVPKKAWDFGVSSVAVDRVES